jgi:hypothetical protein
MIYYKNGVNINLCEIGATPIITYHLIINYENNYIFKIVLFVIFFFFLIQTLFNHLNDCFKSSQCAQYPHFF